MSIQLKKMGVKADKQKICKADGIIHLAGHENLEVLVLEPAGAYGHNDHANITFDNSKGTFALMATIKKNCSRYNTSMHLSKSSANSDFTLYSQAVGK